MLTKEQFDQLERDHQVLMLSIEGQLEVVHSINKMNPIKFMLDVWFFHRSKSAIKKAWSYLKESQKLIDKLSE